MRIRHKRADLTGFKLQKCTVCNCEDKFNFYVPDEIWREVVPREYRNNVACLPCFDEFARKKNFDYADSIEVLYFAGRQASFKFQTVSAQSV
ncbi:MAG: hypothetical protein ACREQ2_24315 [Candidatus Binatia bacterium]